MMLLGGATVPLTFFPHVAQRIFALFPFRSIYFVPIEAYLGKLSTGGLAWAVLEAWGWVAVLSFLVERPPLFPKAR